MHKALQMHDTQILLPRKLNDRCSIYATFEGIHPGPGNYYSFHPTINKSVNETSLDLLAFDKRKLQNYHSLSSYYLQIVKTTAWIGLKTMQFSNMQQGGEGLRLENVGKFTFGERLAGTLTVAKLSLDH